MSISESPLIVHEMSAVSAPMSLTGEKKLLVCIAIFQLTATSCGSLEPYCSQTPMRELPSGKNHVHARISPPGSCTVRQLRPQWLSLQFSIK
jgi:hypothetical protein